MAEAKRYVYQTSRGGQTYCPLEERARIICSATPLFPGQISYKYAQRNVRGVKRDLEENHGHKVATSTVSIRFVPAMSVHGRNASLAETASSVRYATRPVSGRLTPRDP